MALIAHLRSRCGLRHVHLEPGLIGDGEVAERVERVARQIGAVPDGESWTLGLDVLYFTVGREGFRISIPDYPCIEGIDVWGSGKAVAEFSRMWKEDGR
ncbi:MAG TPA: hypothetical protein VHS28_06885 [Chloroflexota bacterium]|nr:hypothetical protein [Chloroflexota bacterium]